MRIGVDLGGTKIRAGLIDSDNKVVKSLTDSCRSDGSIEDVAGQIVSLVSGLFDSGVELIGVGVPAIVDSEGVVYDCVNIPSWHRVELKAMLEAHFGVPVKVNNDCNCFALGVRASEIARGYKDLVCMTLGTGVGAGVILNGQLYTGRNCGAGEIGSIQYNGSDYESWCSSRFFTARGTTGKDAFADAEAGKPEALALWNEFGTHVGELVKMCLFAYDPEAVVIGGSISNAFQYFEKSLRRTLASFPYSSVAESLAILSDPSGDFMMLGSVV